MKTNNGTAPFSCSGCWSSALSQDIPDHCNNSCRRSGFQPRFAPARRLCPLGCLCQPGCSYKTGPESRRYTLPGADTLPCHRMYPINTKIPAVGAAFSRDSRLQGAPTISDQSSLTSLIPSRTQAQITVRFYRCFKFVISHFLYILQPLH